MAKIQAIIVKFREPLLVLAAGVLILLVHAGFRIHGFGELDQARDARDVIVWHLRGSAALDDFSYRLRISALFMRWLKFAVDHGMAIRRLPGVMGWFSIVMSSICSMALYYLFKRLSDTRVAIAATVVYAFTPGFWLCSIYGMPTVAAEAFMICAALAFADALERGPRTVRGAVMLGAASLLCWLSFTHKADVALGASVLLALPLLSKRDERLDVRKLGIVLGLGALVVGAATLGTIGFAHALGEHPNASDGSRSTSQFYASWRDQYPLSVDNLLNPGNNSPITHTTGSLWFAVAILAVLHGLTSDPARRRRTLLLCAWALPSTLFWGLVAGNSTRHNVPAAAAWIFLAVLFLFDTVEQRTRAFVLCALVTLFSCLDTTGGGTVNPPFDFLKTSRELDQASSEYHGTARKFMRSPAARKALIDSDYYMAYGEFEAFAAAKTPSLTYDPQTVHDGPGNATQLVDVHIGDSHRAHQLAASMRRDGWAVCSIQFGFCDGN